MDTFGIIFILTVLISAVIIFFFNDYNVAPQYYVEGIFKSLCGGVMVAFVLSLLLLSASVTFGKETGNIIEYSILASEADENKACLIYRDENGEVQTITVYNKDFCGERDHETLELVEREMLGVKTYKYNYYTAKEGGEIK